MRPAAQFRARSCRLSRTRDRSRNQLGRRHGEWLRRLADRSVGGVRCGVGDGCEGVELALGQARAAARSVERLTASHAASSVARACPAAAASHRTADPAGAAVAALTSQKLGEMNGGVLSTASPCGPGRRAERSVAAVTSRCCATTTRAPSPTRVLPSRTSTSPPTGPVRAARDGTPAATPASAVSPPLRRPPRRDHPRSA